MMRKTIGAEHIDHLLGTLHYLSEHDQTVLYPRSPTDGDGMADIREEFCKFLAFLSDMIADDWLVPNDRIQFFSDARGGEHWVYSR